MNVSCAFFEHPTAFPTCGVDPPCAARRRSGLERCDMARCLIFGGAEIMSTVKMKAFCKGKCLWNKNLGRFCVFLDDNMVVVCF